MIEWVPPSEEEQMIMAQRASGGHPIGAIRGKEHVIESNKSIAGAKAAAKTASIVAAKAEIAGRSGLQMLIGS